MSSGEFGLSASELVLWPERRVPGTLVLYSVTPYQLLRNFVLAIPRSLVVSMITSDSSRDPLQMLAYAALSKYFREHEDEVIEIEILPPAIVPTDGIIMQDGLNLGIPKKVLALAYLASRKDFFECKDHQDASVALEATKVMLLFDPEHLTAAGYRKQRLSRLKAAAEPCVGSPFHKALRQELCFLNSILTSPLHRQSKSPTLWYHRLWILDPLIEIESKYASEEEKSAFLLSEIAAICKSGEKHPKNYYAWQYARRLIRRIESRDTREEFACYVKDWCCKNPSDISGWSFLLHLISGLPLDSTSHNLVRAVISYAINLRADQESLWVFIRTALALEESQDPTLYAFLCDYKKDLANINSTALLSQRVTSALNWIEANRIYSAEK